MSIELKNDFSIKNYDILDISCNNNALNVVPKYCSITLESHNNVVKSLKETDNIKITSLNQNKIKIESFGISSHAAHPELGKNAIKLLVEFLLNNFEFNSTYLSELYNSGLFEIYSPQFLSNKKIEDESGILTSNVAVLEYVNEKLIIKTNLRVPVNTSLDSIKEKYNFFKKKFDTLEINSFGIQEPLYVSKDSYLVKTLVEIYNKKTNSNKEAIAIGGGTYEIGRASGRERV